MLTVSAHLCETSVDSNALFLYCTLPELRTMKVFREDDWADYPTLQIGLIHHLYETYQPRTAADLKFRVTAM